LAYALGGFLLLVCVVFYAAVETWRELRHDQQQMAEAKRTANINHRELVPR
jgi:hypothetical protein